MASVIPHTPGTGNNIPLSNYVAGISSLFPSTLRQRLVETSINSKERVDFMPSNVGVNNTLDDKYLEFRISGVQGVFLDLASLTLELSADVTDVHGNKLGNDATIGLVNGISNSLFKTANVFINEKLVESTPFYNYVSYIKLLKEVGVYELANIGRCAGLYNDVMSDGSVANVYRDDDYKVVNSYLANRMTDIKTNGIQTCFSLMLDLSSLDMYLLDGVDVRIRLEVANTDWLINSVDADRNGYKFKINTAKLWVDRVFPQYNALAALNDTLNNSNIEYVFNKSLVKSYMIGVNQRSIMIEQPFNTCIPEKLYMCFIPANNFAGGYTNNPLYFSNSNLENVNISINGSTIYNIKSDFNRHPTTIYYECLKTLGLDSKHMLTYDSFKNGRTLLCFNFVYEDMKDAIPVELSANMRISITFGQVVTQPYIVLLIGETVGLLTVDRNRIVHCDVRG